MFSDPKPGFEPKVDCRVCLREVPLSEAKSVEGREYVLYFCGLECFDHWSRSSEKPPPGHR